MDVIRSLISALAFTPLLLLAQDRERYDALVNEAKTHYEQADHAMAASLYSQAFEALGWKGYSLDRYNAACAYALAGVPDSAFFHLFRIAEKMDHANLGHLSTDLDLTGLHGDPRWSEVIGLVSANRARLDADLDHALVALLDPIFENDQGPRRAIHEIEARFGHDSPEMQDHWQAIHLSDSLNQIAVRRILDERGWLGADVIGGKGNQTLFLVIQHADQTIQETYLPLMREAVDKGNAQARSLALLEDRVALGRGQHQLYGSQIGQDPETGEHFVRPLHDPDNVDQRRHGMGLPPLAEYLLNWDLVWDVDAYKKMLPGLEERFKNP